MPYTKLNHQRSLKALCLICLKKRASLRPLTTEQKFLITAHIFSEFENFEQFLPSGICNECRLKLGAFKTSDPPNFSHFPDFSRIVNDICTGKTGGEQCSCDLCEIAGWTKKKGGSNPPTSKYLLPQLQKPSGLQKSPQPSTSIPPDLTFQTDSLDASKSQSPPVLRCSFCHTDLSQNKLHECTPSVRRQNLIGQLTPKGKAHAAASFVRERVESSGSQTVHLENPRGRPTEVTVALAGGSRAKRSLYKPPPLSHETVFAMQDVAGLSDNALLKQSTVIRQETQNRQAIASNLKAALVTRGHRLSPFFGFKPLPFVLRGEKGEPEKCPKPAVVVKDLTQMIKFVSDVRQLSNYRLKLGLDGGGGFLKVTLNVIEDSVPKSSSSPLQKKALLGSEKFLDTGVKKLFIVGLAQNVPESYENVKTLVREIPLEVSFCTSADLKMLNILVGVGPHSSSCPCTWCEGHVNDFKSNFQSPLRSFGRIREQSRKFKTAIRERKKFPAPQFFSCVEEPILNVPDDVLVIDAIAPPQLHLMMGCTSKIWDELLLRLEKDPNADKSAVEQWARLRNIAKKAYRGGTMEGNQCRKLLRESIDLIPQLPQRYKMFGLALHRFDAVVTSCFGMNIVGDYQKAIADFHSAYIALNLSVTPKVHCVFVHVPDWIKRHEARTGQRFGLGWASEQASESVHRDFLAKWNQGYKVAESHEKYPEQLLSCVIKYNSHHI